MALWNSSVASSSGDFPSSLRMSKLTPISWSFLSFHISYRQRSKNGMFEVLWQFVKIDLLEDRGHLIPRLANDSIFQILQ